MHKYTIYCTEAQTKKALELGAPLRTFSESFADGYRTSIYDRYCSIPPIKEEGYEDDVYADIPTAEQMIGWLRKEKGLYVKPYLNGECCYSFSPIVSTKEDGEIIHLEAEDDPDKATLAAIDAALEYLTNKKQ